MESTASRIPKIRSPVGVDINAVADMIQGTSLVATPSKLPIQRQTIPNRLRMYRFEVTALAGRISQNVKTESKHSVPEMLPKQNCPDPYV